MELTTMILQGRAGSNVTFMQGADSGIAYARFRLAVPRSRRNDEGKWEDLEPHWYTVKAWGELAKNVRSSVSVGDPLVVVGQPRAGAWIGKEGEARSEMAVHAATVGHDMVKGISSFGRRVPDGQIPDPATGQTSDEADVHVEHQVDSETGEILDPDTAVISENGPDLE